MRFDMPRVRDTHLVMSWRKQTRAIVAALAGAALLCLALSAVATGARHCGSVYWRSIRNGDQRCPRTHSILSDWHWANLHWSTWNTSGATGHGIAIHHTGYQVDERDPIQIRLSRTRRCLDGRRIYTRINVTWQYATIGTRSYSWPYHCTPRDAPSGVGAGGG